MWIRWHVGLERGGATPIADGRWDWGLRTVAVDVAGVWEGVGGGRVADAAAWNVAVAWRLWAAPKAEQKRVPWPPAPGESRGFGVRSPASPFPVGSMAADVRGGCQVGVIVATNRSDLKEVWMAHGRGRQPGAAGFVRPWGAIAR